MRLLANLLALPALLRCSVAYTTLSDSVLESLTHPGSDFDIHDGRLLSPILQTRVPGTPGSEAVLRHFVDFFRSELPEWRLSFQNSTSTTPVSNGQQVPFKNLIATRDPPWTDGQEGEVGRLALVAHYDSKLTPIGFIGATDSAAPCAMLLHAAQSIDAALTKKWAAMRSKGVDVDDLDGHKGIQILLLDGEEAFKVWTDTDSIYGARALAEEWEHTFHPALSTYSNPLDSIDLFVLLDLLGAATPRIPSYFKTTHWAYQKLAHLELRLRKLGKFKSSPNHRSNRERNAQLTPPKEEPLFLPESGKTDSDPWVGGMIGDDHVPFLARGVEVLHIIPTPFPGVWHHIDDDGEHLDMATTEDWAVLTAAFAGEWMELDGYFDGAKETKGKDKRSPDIENEKTEFEFGTG